MKQTFGTIKTQAFRRGFAGWYVIGNLWSISLIIFITHVPQFIAFFGLPIVTATIISVLLMLGRNRIAYGIVTAVITNILIYAIISFGFSDFPLDSLQDYLDVFSVILLFGVNLPLPFGLFLAVSN